MRVERTTVGVARPHSDSLRTTIPRGVVIFLSVDDGDKLEWEMQANPSGKRTAIVKKVVKP